MSQHWGERRTQIGLVGVREELYIVICDINNWLIERLMRMEVHKFVCVLAIT